MDNVEDIIRFKRALEDPDSDTEYSDNGPSFSTNRGNKLRSGARQVSCRTLRKPGDRLGVRIVDYNGHKRAVIARTRSSSLDTPSSDDELLDYEVDGPGLESINLDALLRPAADPADVATHPAISKTFSSPKLRNMAREMLDVIVDEKSHVTKISNLLGALLGDDPEALRLQNLSVRDYKTVHDGPVETSAPQSSDHIGITSLSAPANTNGVKEEPVDNFFAPPDLHIDKNFGVSADTAEEARQLLQIAHQRLEEYVRCMTVIRMGFTRADRLRRQVYNLCREANNEDYVLDDIDPYHEMKPTQELDPEESGPSE